MGEIFYAPRAMGPRRQEMLAAVSGRHPSRFPTPASVAAWMDLVFVPRSQRWSYVRNGKSGTTSTVLFLFELEFGVPLTAKANVPQDVNPDAVPHQLANADVFRPLSVLPGGLEAIGGALRLATVRHPVDRLVSAFLYLCKTQEERHPWFLRERLRMNALVGFDWDEDIHRARGFEKFLLYVEKTLSDAGPKAVDAHWRPQVATVLPDIYRPNLVGKMENLGAFFREIAERLDQPLSEDWVEPRANVTSDRSMGESLVSPTALTSIRRLYEQDFEAFDYQPDAPTTRSSGQ